MFRIIGASVVYGFAAYGLIVWLGKRREEHQKAEDQSFAE